MSAALLLLTAAQADVLVSDISTEHALSVQGLWPIPIDTEVGWMLGVGLGGGFSIGRLDLATWSVENLHEISPRADLKDHSLARCLDGSWLHVSSAEADQGNPVFRYTEGFGLISESVIANSVPAHTPNDGIALCTGPLLAAGFAQRSGEADYIYRLDGEQSSRHRRWVLAQSPRLTGAGTTNDRCERGVFHIAGFDVGPELVIATYDHDLSLVDRHTITPLDSEETVYYWPTGFITVEGGYLVALMGQARGSSWGGDDGNLYLWVLSESLELLEAHQISSFVPKSGGGMRPWLDLDLDAEGGPLIVLSIDKDGHPVLYSARLDAETLAAAATPCDPVDTGAADSGVDRSDWPTSGSALSTTGCAARSLLLPGLVCGWRLRRRAGEEAPGLTASR